MKLPHFFFLVSLFFMLFLRKTTFFWLVFVKKWGFNGAKICYGETKNVWLKDIRKFGLIITYSIPVLPILKHISTHYVYLTWFLKINQHVPVRFTHHGFKNKPVPITFTSQYNEGRRAKLGWRRTTITTRKRKIKTNNKKWKTGKKSEKLKTKTKIWEKKNGKRKNETRKT